MREEDAKICAEAILKIHNETKMVLKTLENSMVNSKTNSKGIIKEIREFVKDPQHGSCDYGSWGILTEYQRHKIHQLLDYAEELEKIVDEKYGKGVK